MKKILFIPAVAALALILVGGGLYSAARAKPSDVSQPQHTPDSNMVKYHVTGTSMDPTIKDGDWLLAYTKPETLKRGDIVIMKYPKDETKVYCRRLVAEAGDKVVMKYYSNVKITTVFTKDNPGGVVFPQGVTPNGNAYGEYETTVPEGSYYVVGDNTAPGGSFDSDEWGTLPASDVVGVVAERTSPNPKKF